MQGYPIVLTADRGASKTVLSKRVYESMRPEERPPLRKACKLIGAGGTTINELGKGEFTIQLGTVSLQVEAEVAETDDDGLLGVDALQNNSNGPVDLILSKGVLVIGKQEIPIIQVGLSARVRRVTTADHLVIPIQSESVAEVFIERQENDDYSCVEVDYSCEEDYCAEPIEHIKETHHPQMVLSLDDRNNASTYTKVRLLNPFPNVALIQHDAVVGQAEPIHVQLEEREEAENHASIRRIDFCTKDPSQGTKPKRHKWDLHIGDQGDAYKSASCESIKMKPNQQPMVREVCLQGEWVCGSAKVCEVEDITTCSENVDFMRARRQLSRSRSSK